MIRRGLTLVETLAATVLLAALGAAMASLWADVMRLSPSTNRVGTTLAPDPVALDIAVSEWMRADRSLRARLVSSQEFAPLSIEGPIDGVKSRIQAIRLTPTLSTDTGLPHAWAAFTIDDAPRPIWRFVPMPNANMRRSP